MVYQGFRGRQRRSALYFLGVGSTQIFQGHLGASKISFGFYGEGSWGKHFPELIKPFAFQGEGSFVGVPACLKAIAFRKPSLMVLWLCHSNVDKAEPETPLSDIMQNKCNIAFRYL